eukprot:10695294-Alexandrium_andersonii.AAC.1
MTRGNLGVEPSSRPRKLSCGRRPGCRAGCHTGLRGCASETGMPLAQQAAHLFARNQRGRKRMR